MKSLLTPLINLLYAHCTFTDCFSFKDLYKSDNDSHNQTRTGKYGDALNTTTTGIKK